MIFKQKTKVGIMNKYNLAKIMLGLFLVFSILSMIPVAKAAPPEEWGPKPWPWQHGGWPAYLYKKPRGNWIGAWPFLYPDMDEWWIPHDDYSWFRMGWQVSDFEIEVGWDPGPPYEFRLIIDGEEIHMQRWCRRYKDELVTFPDGVDRIVDSRAWFCSVVFDPYYFEVGDHEIRFQFLVKKPYYGSDSNEWRYYVNYHEGEMFEWWYGEFGLVWDRCHTLHVY